MGYDKPAPFDSDKNQRRRMTWNELIPVFGHIGVQCGHISSNLSNLTDTWTRNNDVSVFWMGFNEMLTEELMTNDSHKFRY